MSEQQISIWVAVVCLLPALAVFYLSRRKSKEVEVGQAPQIFPDKFTPFKLIGKEAITHNTNLYRFALPDPTRPLGLSPGQHVQIRSTFDEGVEVMKPYTPVSPASTLGHFDLLIKTYPAGRISKYMDSVAIGELVEMRGPKGSFKFDKNMTKRVGMIAGGTGITPLLSVTRAILEDPQDCTNITMIFANKTPEDCLLEQELDDLMAKHQDRFKVYYTVDIPNEKWTREQGLVTEQMIRKYLPESQEDCRILICGPPPMMAMVIKELESVGFTAPTVDESKVFKF